MIESFNRFVDYFIHPALKADKSLYEKSKVSVFTFIIVLLIIFLYGLFYLSQGYYFDIKALHNYLGILTTAAGLILIKKTGKTNLALSCMSFMGVYLVTASVYLSGGINSNDILWYIVLSTAVFMFVDTRTGFTVTALCLLGMTMFYLIEVFHLKSFDADVISLTAGYKYFNFLLILCLLSLMVYVLVRGNKKLQEVIQLSKEQKVREEIARDFHDQIGNKLASLRHLAELIKMNKSAEEKATILSKIDNNAKDVYDNFRDFIWTLDVKSDYAQELFMYLRDFADDYFKFSDVNLYVNSSPEELPDFMLPGYLSKEIVPLFKEAITNIRKHAEAKNVHMDYILSNDSLTIKLKDDGKGIDEKLLRKGNGLKNIQHRAERTGGKLEIITTLLKGTEIIYSVKLPLKGS